jgi:hypothetical protein
MKMPTAHDHGNCELCDALEQDRQNLIGLIESKTQHLHELGRRLKAKSTVFHIIRELKDGNFINEQIVDSQQGPDGVHITIR